MLTILIILLIACAIAIASLVIEVIGQRAEVRAAKQEACFWCDKHTAERELRIEQYREICKLQNQRIK